MYKLIRILGVFALLVQAILIPLLVDIFHPSNLEFPQKISHGMTLDQTMASWKSIQQLKGTTWEDREGSIYVYIFVAPDGKVVQHLYGSDAWNTCAFYDIDKDGLDEFFARQHDAFTGRGDVVVSAFKFQDDKYFFWKFFTRNQLPLYLDYKFFGMGYWMLAFFVEIVVVATLLIWFISWLIIRTRSARNQIQ